MLQEILGDYCVLEVGESGEVVIRTSSGVVLVVQQEGPLGESALMVAGEPTRN